MIRTNIKITTHFVHRFLIPFKRMNSLADVVKAADFAARKHKDQRRKAADQIPYINHPIGVAHSLMSEGGIDDPVVIQAALLHDTVEDTDTTLDEIEEHFGKSVRDVVKEVTDDKNLPKAERKRLQIVNAPHKSPQAKLVKLADKLYNLRDLQRLPPDDWSETRIHEYFVWASYVVHGLKGTNEKLETKLAEVLAERNVEIAPPPSSI